MGTDGKVGRRKKSGKGEVKGGSEKGREKPLILGTSLRL